MKPLTQARLGGTWATLLLPINQDESIDFVRLADELDQLLGTGVQGIYTNGTAAEFYSQTEAEFDAIHQLLAERCEKAGMAFQIGANHTSAQVSLTRLHRAIQLKPGAIQVVLPDWYPLTDDEAIAFLGRMAEIARPVGLVLYNPPHAKRVLGPESYGKICRAVPELLGIKVAPADKAWFDAVHQQAPRLAIFVPGHHLATGSQWGAAGSYSNVACLQPAGAARWYDLIKNDLPAALALESRIQAFLQRHVVPLQVCNAAKDKFMAAIGGWANAGTRLRWPYKFVPESEVKRAQPLARQSLPELFEPADH
jgi:dihydrodipicolinate synthase/N-acetylneuraminate lyase